MNNESYVFLSFIVTCYNEETIVELVNAEINKT